ncbi:MAG TPA: hypothetical protein DCY13_21560 [Verrucomicrobiales bacterium]|nr:hypothetical protein [Verrucomicrobiales bacterium]
MKRPPLVTRFGIAHNTLAPAEWRFLAPWARSGQPGDPAGGGCAELRRPLGAPTKFPHGFELQHLRPDHELVRRASGVMARVLGQPGRQYAIYFEGRAPDQIELNLPDGTWNLRWLDTRTAAAVRVGQVNGSDQELTTIQCPGFDGEIALGITR